MATRPISELPATDRDQRAESELNRFAEAVERYLAGDLPEIELLPMRVAHGVHPQRQGAETVFLRTKLPAGLLNADGLLAMAEVVEAYGQGVAHLTTRQNIELNSIAMADVAAALRRLNAAGVSTRQACGKTVRNIVTCQRAGTCRMQVIDVLPPASAMAEHFATSSATRSMISKFKIGLSGCTADCASAVIQDVGVVAVEVDGRRGYRLLVGGGLGTDPRLGSQLEAFTDPADLIDTVEAVLRVWDAAFPDRSRRSKTRVRNLVQRIGMAEFTERVLAERARLRADRVAIPTNAEIPRLAETPLPAGAAQDGAAQGAAGRDAADQGTVAPVTPAGQLCTVYVPVPLGTLDAAGLRALAGLSSRYQISWRTTIGQDLIGQRVSRDLLPVIAAELVKVGLSVRDTPIRSSVVSCPGTAACAKALAPSRDAAALVARGLDQLASTDLRLKVNISGCHNSCAHHQLADIGLSGAVRRDAEGTSADFRVLLGGRRGATRARLGTVVARLPAETAPLAVTALIQRYLDEQQPREQQHNERQPGAQQPNKQHSRPNRAESFGDWVDRLGVDAIGAWLANAGQHTTE